MEGQNLKIIIHEYIFLPGCTIVKNRFSLFRENEWREECKLRYQNRKLTSNLDDVSFSIYSHSSISLSSTFVYY